VHQGDSRRQLLEVPVLVQAGQFILRRRCGASTAASAPESKLRRRRVGAEHAASMPATSHAAVPGRPRYRGDGQIDYGETVVTMRDIREHWSRRFELLEVDLLLEDPHQVMLTMRRR
jgi:hypothetical protein